MSKKSTINKVLERLKLKAKPLPNGNLYICIGLTDIASGSGICRKTASTVMNHLVDDGVVIKHKDSNTHGHLTNCYEIITQDVK